jgi:murein DD-endopeptidase MepM/ murein hydrolase activator NlpD/3D (Asp-Asp-Asp) domain-containing protein
VNEQDIERMYQSAAKNALTKSLKTASNAAWKTAKFCGKKIVPAVITAVMPILLPMLALAGLAFFVYFSVFMIPKYIMNPGGADAPFEAVTTGIMRVEATGYTAGYESTGKRPGDPGYGITSTGAKAQRGVIAVDPRVIPYGTHMYIPGYGYGVALDTGGAIKGQKIDLFYNTVQEANDWGRRWVTIQLLGKGEPNIDYANTDLQNLAAEVAILSFGKTDIEWPLMKDAELYRKYLQLDADWIDSYRSNGELAESTADSASGNASISGEKVSNIWNMSGIPSEKEQVDPHRVSWSLVASLDKVLGDPVVHGDSGLESEGHGRKPNPDKHFQKLCPELEWQTFTLAYYETWTKNEEIEEKVGDKIVKKTVKKTYEKEYKKNIKLLTSAKCYDANYQYTWEENVVEQKTANGYKKIVTPQVASVTRNGPYYENLRAILKEEGIGSDIDLELVLRFAETIDPAFQIDYMLFGTPIEISIDTEGGWDFSGNKFPVNPCAGRVTSPYGMRYHPIYGENRMHTGIDIGAPHGTPVYAVKDGYVVYKGVMGGYGNTILVEHGDCRTLYAHLSKITVKAGEMVQAGQKIGEVGSTGNSTGPHLHFEVRTGKDRTEYVDPAKYLKY